MQDIRTLFDYDTWATGRALESVSSVPVDRYLEDLKSSHGEIHGTFVHIYGSNMIWLQRWRGSSALWKEYQADLNSYFRSLDEAKLNGFLSYNDLKGNRQSEPLFQQMQHLINHSSYHRGEIVTMLRQVGSKPIGTDLITFYRTKTTTTLS